MINNPKIVIKHLILCIFFILVILSVNSCTYNNEEDLYPNQNCDTTVIGFKKDILPLIINKCSDCHGEKSPKAGIRLDSYETISVLAASPIFLKVINYESGYKGMPENGKMSDCNINKITAWVMKGAKDD